MRWVICIWSGPSADGLDPHLAPNAAMPSMDPRLAPNIPPSCAEERTFKTHARQPIVYIDRIIQMVQNRCPIFVQIRGIRFDHGILIKPIAD